MGNPVIQVQQKPIEKVEKNTKKTSYAKYILLTLGLVYFFVLLVIPLVAVFVKGFEKGLEVYWAALTDPMAASAIQLTLITIGVVVPINTIFGITAAWCITKYRFKGRNLLLTMIDLPFAISPVIAGLVFVLLFSTTHGIFGKWLDANDIQIIFAKPGIVLATLFVTFPFVARELIPFMEAQGVAEEEAALILGASGWQTFFKITLPNIKWALLYGIMLTAARAAGEFGAVSVVSGHIRGVTNTLPLHIEILYNEYNFVAAFAVASILTFFAVIHLLVKNLIEWKIASDKKNLLGSEEAREDEY